MSNTYSVGV